MQISLKGDKGKRVGKLFPPGSGQRASELQMCMLTYISHFFIFISFYQYLYTGYLSANTLIINNICSK